MEYIPMDEIKPALGSTLKLTDNHPTYDEQKVHTVFLQVLPGNLGDVYFGRENMDITVNPKIGVIARLRPPTDNHLPDLAFQAHINISNPTKASAFRLAVDNLGDGALPTLGIA